MYNWTGLPETINDPVAGAAGAEPVNCCKVNNTEALNIWLPVKVLLPVDANDAVLALVTNDPVTLFKLPIEVKLVAISVAILDDVEVNEPEIFAVNALVAISVARDELRLAVWVSTCASVAYVASNEELNASFAATLPAKDELNVVDEPVIPAAVKLLIKVALVPNEPEISLAICAELDNKVFPNSDSAVVILPAREELNDVDDPEISDAIWAELDNAPTNVPENVVEVTEPVTATLPVNWWVSSNVSPNWVLPDCCKTTDCVSSVLNTLAMIVSDTSNDPVKWTVLPDWGVMFVTFNVLILNV